MFQVFFIVQQTSVNWTLSLKKVALLFTPPEIYKRYAVFLGIHARCTNPKISECLGINLRTVQRIRKEFDESNDDYKSAAVHKPHSDRWNKKKNSRICWGDPDCDRWQSQIVTQVHSQGHCTIWVSYGISHIKWKRVNFYLMPWKTRGKTALKSFRTHSSIPSNWKWFCFSQMKKFFLTGSDGELIEQRLTFAVPTRFIDMDKNQTPSTHYGVRDTH